MSDHRENSRLSKSSCEAFSSRSFAVSLRCCLWSLLRARRNRHSSNMTEEILAQADIGGKGLSKGNPNFFWANWGPKTGPPAPFLKLSSGKANESTKVLERAMGIEPTSEDWEARNPNKIQRTRLRLLQPSVLG